MSSKTRHDAIYISKILIDISGETDFYSLFFEILFLKVRVYGNSFVALHDLKKKNLNHPVHTKT